jgi:hypothetical protein
MHDGHTQNLIRGGMMAILGDELTPELEEWHEELLIISLLQQGPLCRKELRQKIRRIQETKMAEYGSHSDSAYNYWIRALKARGIVDEQDGLLGLTPLGSWIACSRLGTISQRNAFLYLVCHRCSSRNRTVLRTPQVDTTEVNAKGIFFMDVKCPRCGHLEERYRLSPIIDRDSIRAYYNQAIEELGRSIRLDAEKM